MAELQTQSLKSCDQAWINVNLATFSSTTVDQYGSLRNHALGVKNGLIACITPMSSVTATQLPFNVIDGHNGWITPGLIDCHTHLVFGGHRAQEFELRLRGIPHQQLLHKGGGILATTRATRIRSQEQLIKSALPRIKALAQEGTTCIEVKSGYGLNLEDEIKMLKVAQSLPDHYPIKIMPTLFIANTIPPEYAGRISGYVDMICDELIPTVAHEKLASAIDIHCDCDAYSQQQRHRLFEAAIESGLMIKAHAEQQSCNGGASLASFHKAHSCDHLEYISEEGVEDMARAKAIAVLLPGTHYFMQSGQCPPVALFRKHQVPIAVASDTNPGTSPLASIRLMMNMSCIFFRLTPAEALAGTTINAAKALGIEDQYGSIDLGKNADLCLWEIDHPNELPYQLGHCPLKQRIISGRIIDEYQ
ncbi:imidazolonepropionase [Endozoicomonas sp. OPT23]|uniref:imidazolonepropionase n=1 Tax=Endozoicomonas sp. OPT23 TaxID=2072845 RepID=UPI00129B1DF6|nr:imidazolonepropionase [Endozoicomonas sp. OPT23]MRI34735.1 imidazolonepropionase [Endozoicomonas sp. OPT23]